MMHNYQAILALISVSFMLPACQVVKVKQQTLAVSLSNERDSILLRPRLSEATLSVLTSTGQDDKLCMEQPAQCLTALKKVPQIQDEQYLSIASELYIAKVNALKESASCQSPFDAKAGYTSPAGLNNKVNLHAEPPQKIDDAPYYQCIHQQQALLAESIRYAYAYLFYTQRDANQRLFDNRQVQVRDFYNQATANLVTLINISNKNYQFDEKPYRIGQNTFYFYPHLSQDKSLPASTELLTTYDLNFRGLQSINRRDGFGTEFVSILPEQVTKPAHTVETYSATATQTAKTQPASTGSPDNEAAAAKDNIHQARYIPVTMVVQPKGNSVQEILQTRQFDVQVYNPYDYQKIQVEQQSYPLAANFSAPYGLWLARTDLAVAAYRGLLAREDRLVAPQLYMLEPYNPKKRVIIMIHGLASSPEAWISLTHNVLGDTILRDHYQVWQVFYSTNMPILESRYQIHALIENAFKQVDPSDQNFASQQAVLIGHSMGGIISRLLMSNDDFSQKALADIAPAPRKKLLALPLVVDRFKMHSLPQVGRMVLISSPLRGTDYADRWFTRAIRQIIRLPKSFGETILTGLQKANLDQQVLETIHNLSLSKIQNGPSDLSKKSEFTHLTQNAHIVQGLPYHLIMGNNQGDVPKAQMNDGIVPYTSAHLDGAVSEKIIEGGHSIQETPEAVLELRRILRLHLDQLGDVKETPAERPKT